MNDRISIKICGQSGQGIDTIGKILCKSLKNCGFFVIGYREYPSLIKGGNATFQIDISNNEIRGINNSVDIVVVLNEQQTHWNEDYLIDGGTIIHNINSPRFTTQNVKTIDLKKIAFYFVPTRNIVRVAKASPNMENIALISKLWQILELPKEKLLVQIEQTFKGKDQTIIEKNLLVCDKAYLSPDQKWFESENTLHPKSSPLEMQEKGFDEMQKKFSLLKYCNVSNFDDATQNLTMNGNEALSEGAISSGIESFFAYPMTPSSSILSTLAELGEKNGILVKQAEDEISAASMTLGAMAVGERALTATSGGGFDLMSEHISFALIAEIPFVIILAQRPGPATGLPTWTAQGDLLLAIFAGHGESTRIVLAATDILSCYEEIQVAFNLAETYQVPVILLTDKFLAETYFTVNPRNLMPMPKFRNLLSSSDVKPDKLSRYGLTKSGVSTRWKVGELSETFCINSDEHDENGDSTEDSSWSTYMNEKRNMKSDVIRNQMPDPEYFTNTPKFTKNKVKIISWGSTKGVIMDVVELLEKDDVKVECLHYTYLWPLKTDILEKFIDVNTICVENNYSSQLAKLIKMETGIEIPEKALKYDGRPFFVDELYMKLKELIEDQE